MRALQSSKFVSRLKVPLPKERHLVELLNGSEKALCVWIPNENPESMVIGVFEVVQGHHKGERYKIMEGNNTQFLLYRIKYPQWKL